MNGLDARCAMSEIDSNNPADAVMWQTLQKLGFEGRVRLTFALSNSLRSISEAGVRRRHPDSQVRLAATKLAIGADLFKLAYPHEDVQP